MDLNHIRKIKTEHVLRGRGMEIGAGMAPHPLPPNAEAVYFDLRNAEELQAYFASTSVPYDVHPIADVATHLPDGADFLIAHHVLEHTPDPIGVLKQWRGYLKTDGVMVITLPNYKLCPDKGRLLPSFEHILLDHLLDRGADSFESREHVLSFLTSWADVSPAFETMSKFDVCRHISTETHRSGHDFHWHAYDHALARQTIMAACLLEGLAPTFVVDDSQLPDGERDAIIDMMFAYTASPIAEAPPQARAQAADTAAAIDAIRNKLIRAANQVPPTLTAKEPVFAGQSFRIDSPVG